MKRFVMLGGLFVLCLIALSTTAHAQIIGPNPGEGKYRFCQRMYDACMGGVFANPGSQSYNVGQARCRAKWNDCRKTKTWTIGRSAGDFRFEGMDLNSDGFWVDSEDSVED